MFIKQPPQNMRMYFFRVMNPSRKRKNVGAAKDQKRKNALQGDPEIPKK